MLWQDSISFFKTAFLMYSAKIFYFELVANIQSSAFSQFFLFFFRKTGNSSGDKENS